MESNNDCNGGALRAGVLIILIEIAAAFVLLAW